MQNLIYGKKIKIRKATPQDVALLCKWYGDGNIMVHVGFENGLQEDPMKLRERLLNQPDSECLFIVMDKKEIPIGECNFNHMDHEKCHIGIKICEAGYQGKGYGEDALRSFIQYLFASFGIQSIELDTLIENIRAQNLYKKVGFKELQINRDCWVDPSGKSRSAVVMSLTKDDFIHPC